MLKMSWVKCKYKDNEEDGCRLADTDFCLNCVHNQVKNHYKRERYDE